MLDTEKQKENSPPSQKPWQFQAGQSGNPNGRPPKPRCIPDILLKIGVKKVSECPLLPQSIKERFKALENLNLLEAVQMLVYIYALKGESWAVHYIAERTEGKVKQPIGLDADFFEKIQLTINNLNQEIAPEPGTDVGNSDGSQPST